MEQKKIDRINELYKKSKAEGLTPEEAKEQKILRKEYMELIRVNLRSQLNNIDMEQKDGSIVNLGEKYGEKYMNTRIMLQNLPQDPVILLSVINTKLRDFYPSLDQLCKEMEVNKKELTDKLDLIDYAYDASCNQFV